MQPQTASLQSTNTLFSDPCGLARALPTSHDRVYRVPGWSLLGTLELWSCTARLHWNDIRRVLCLSEVLSHRGSARILSIARTHISPSMNTGQP